MSPFLAPPHPPPWLSDRLRKNVSIKPRWRSRLGSGVGVRGPDVKCNPEKWQRGTQIISGRVAARCQAAGILLPARYRVFLWPTLGLGYYWPDWFIGLNLPANWVILTPVELVGKISHTVIIHIVVDRRRHRHRHRRPLFDVWRPDWGLKQGLELRLEPDFIWLKRAINCRADWPAYAAHGATLLPFNIYCQLLLR